MSERPRTEMVYGACLQSWSKEPVEHGGIGTGHVHYLRPVRCPRDQCDRVTANAERGGHHSQGFRGYRRTENPVRMCLRRSPILPLATGETN